MSDMLGFLGGETPSEDAQPSPEPQADTPQAEPTPQPALEPPERGPDGKFAAKATPEATAVETPPQAPETPLSKTELNGVLGATLAERDKRQAAEARVRDLEARIAALEPSPEPAPLEQRMQAEINTLKMQNMRIGADVEHGRTKVQEAYDWAVKKCDDDPAFNQRMFQQIASSGNPYETAMSAFREAADLDAFSAWKAAQAADPGKAIPQTPPPAPTPVPRSLATAPGNGSAGQDGVIQGPGSAFANIIQ